MIPNQTEINNPYTANKIGYYKPLVRFGYIMKFKQPLNTFRIKFAINTLAYFQINK